MRSLCHGDLPNKNNFVSLTVFASISRLRRVHDYTRSAMAQSRLCNLALLLIESKILDLILNDKIIDQFALAESHSILL